MTINTSTKLGFQLPADNDTSWGNAIRGNFTEIENILPSYMFMQDTANTTGLTFALKPGNLKVSATVASYAGGTVALTASATNYVEAYIDSSNKAQVVANTSAFTVGRVPLYEVVTGASAIATTTDVRALLSAEPNANSWIDQFSQDTATTTGLTYGYNGGTVANDNVVNTVAAGTVALTDKATNYVELDPTGTVSANTTSFTSGRIPLATVAVDESAAWAASTAESVGNTVSPSTANGFAYEATTAGTTGLTEPTWPTTLGSTVDDDAGAATWVASNGYAANALALPSTTNGFYYEGDVANKSAPTEPTWPTTEGQTVVDETGFASWAASTPYSAGGDVTPTVLNGFYYEVTTAGTSATTEPTWPTTEGATVTDGGVTWTAHKAITWTAKGIITWQAIAKITGVTDDRTWVRAGGGSSGNATKIQGYSVPAPAATNDGQALEWDNTNQVWKYGAASGGSGGGNLPTLVQEIDISTATTSVTLNNLDINTDGGYILECAFVTPSLAAPPQYNVYVNGDTTDSDYITTLVNGNGTTETTTTKASPFLYGCTANTADSGLSNIYIGLVNGYFNAFSESAHGGNPLTWVSTGIRKTTSDANISSITVRDNSGSTGGIGAGSKFRLYRRNTSGNTPPKPALVQEIDVPAATTNVTFSNLDGNSDGGYVVVVEGSNNTTTSGNVDIYFNGDTNNANYDGVSEQNNGSATLAEPKIATFAASQTPLHAHIEVSQGTNGRQWYSGQWIRSADNVAGSVQGYRNTTDTNITSITITASGTTFATGSKIKLFRRNMSIIDANNATKIQGMPISVPGSAQDGQSLVFNNASQEMEWTTGDTAWIAPTLQNGWVNYTDTSGNSWLPARYRKDKTGFVHLSGMIAGGTVSSTLSAFVIPAGYRPIGRALFSVIATGNAVGRVDVNKDGSVYMVSPSGNNFFSLDGITFLAEQ